MRKLIAISLCILFRLTVNAQEKSERKELFKAGLEVPLLNAKFSWEHGFSDRLSVTTSASFVTYYFNRASFEGERVFTALSAGAMLDVDARYYFNINKRKRLGRITENYSGTYISLQPTVRSPLLLYKYESDKSHFGNMLAVYLNAGIQRQLKGNFYFNEVLVLRCLPKTRISFTIMTEAISGLVLHWVMC